MKTQASSRPNKYIITGLEGKLELSISNISLPQIENLFFGSDTFTENVTFTRNDTTTVARVKNRINIADFAGTEIAGQKVVIKPYPLVADPATDTGLNPGGYTFGDALLGGEVLNGVTYALGEETLIEDAYLVLRDAYQAWLETFVTFPCGALTDINGTNLAYGLNTQQELKLMITSLPDINGDRIIFGDETAA